MPIEVEMVLGGISTWGKNGIRLKFGAIRLNLSTSLSTEVNLISVQAGQVVFRYLKTRKSVAQIAAIVSTDFSNCKHRLRKRVALIFA
jgi:DNA-directed RNA polymerase subunit E'/Rpb7